MGSVDSSGEMQGMPPMPPQDEPSIIERINNFNPADVFDDKVKGFEDFMNRDAGDLIMSAGRAAWDALTADEERKPGFHDPGIVPEFDPDALGEFFE